MTAEKLSEIFKQKAQKFGFQSCGIAEAEALSEEKEKFISWLEKGFHGEMKFLERNIDLRFDPRLALKDCRSVVSLSLNYFPNEKIENADIKIAKYAYGADYHEVIKEILTKMISELQAEIGEFSFRIFTDSGVVSETVWAQKSGLGWVGKNSLLLSKKRGSFFFLAEIFTDLPLAADLPFMTNHCGTCRRCIDACPTQAIVNERVIDARKCISYATIELKTEIPNFFSGKTDGWIFGCDVCQDVCPWNRFSAPTKIPQFTVNQKIKNFSQHDWQEISEEIFREIFKNSPIKRAKFSGLKRNIFFNMN